MILLMCSPILASAQPTWLWAKKPGSNIITTDQHGNIYTIATLTDSLQLEHTTLYAPQGKKQFVNAKYNNKGNIIWLNQLNTNDSISEEADRLVADTAGNTYVIGKQTGGTNNVFLKKFDKNGTEVWKSEGLRNIDRDSKYLPLCIAIDRSGNIYAAGSYSDSCTFDSLTLTSSGYTNIFLAKFDNEGNVLWMRPITGGGTFVMDICTDMSGKVFLTGYYGGSIIFNTDTLKSTDIYARSYLAKYDSSGNTEWATNIGISKFSAGSRVKASQNGDVYVTGYFSDTLTAGSTVLITNSINRDYYNPYAAGFTSSGNLKWITNMEVSIRPVWGHDLNIHLAVNASNNIYACAYTGSGSGIPGAIHIIKYDTSGNKKWIQTVYGPGYININNACTDGTDGVIVNGTHSRTEFGNHTVVGGKWYFARLSPNAQGIDNTLNKTLTAHVYPNPAKGSFSIISPTEPVSKVYIYDISGRILYHTNVNNHSARIDVQNIQPGIYFVKAYSDSGLICSEKLLIN